MVQCAFKVKQSQGETLEHLTTADAVALVGIWVGVGIAAIGLPEPITIAIAFVFAYLISKRIIPHRGDVDE